MDKEAAEQYYEQAKENARRGDLRLALVNLGAAVRAREGYVEALTLLGAVLEQLGCVGEARASYQDALIFDPNNEEAQAGLAELAAESAPQTPSAVETRPTVSREARHAHEEAVLGELTDVSATMPPTGSRLPWAIVLSMLFGLCAGVILMVVWQPVEALSLSERVMTARNALRGQPGLHGQDLDCVQVANKVTVLGEVPSTTARELAIAVVERHVAPARVETGRLVVVVPKPTVTPMPEPEPYEPKPLVAVEPEPPGLEAEAALATPIPAPPEPPPPGPTPVQVKTYIVRRNDSLWRISEKVYGDGRLWPRIYEANRDQISSPRRLRPKMELTIPPQD